MINKALDKATQSSLTPKIVLNDLINGNQRYTQSNMEVRNYESQRNETVNGQFPKAVILSCIDSRVPIETIFDQGIGDIFVARVAGNFENIDILGSLEYACKAAGSKLVLVLGHESCGAVKSAIDGVELGNITSMLGNILPAVKKTAEEVDGAVSSSNTSFVSKTVENNVALTIDRIREKSPILKEMEERGEIEIVGGVYQLSSGKVILL
ncbi:MAG: carbonic anhydrase [Maribacter sp.]|nr:carbonic anhydrase [Maribacter sp.]